MRKNLEPLIGLLNQGRQVSAVVFEEKDQSPSRRAPPLPGYGSHLFEHGHLGGSGVVARVPPSVEGVSFLPSPSNQPPHHRGDPGHI